ncbi:hypothetical protein [Paraburkholderia caballeronis]|uniref:hypothetical protein n=1 Tax=Paraburkholderia caballeronis TaxID=416943 RepID=UPI001066AA71|nr:hypothetical protein [Paraburkholderia caballeronis]TDV16299.1 hypothetical protein C7406_108160 [Paraburkholderia caballeronis]TDV20649.1 hypothetical protein C7408_101160 [Paraburkholderia caballeronis]TDV33117.1 hypothetical protein C7404_101256 [Paraburkholderia caballeronis]
MNTLITLSQLAHTWLIDLDGTVTKHNSHIRDGDVLLPGVKAFWDRISLDDTIIILTAREEVFRAVTESFLQDSGLRFDRLIMGLPKGERILINDRKPQGLATAIAINIDRDIGFGQIKSIISIGV